MRHRLFSLPRTLSLVSSLLVGLFSLWPSLVLAKQAAPPPKEIVPAASAPSSVPTSAPSSVPASQPQSAPTTTPAPLKIGAQLMPFVPLIDASIDPDTGSLGGKFLYTVRVERSREVEVLLPPELPFPPELEVGGAPKKQTEDLGEGMVRELYSYELQAFGVGTLTVPGFAVVFRAPAGEASVGVPAASLTIPETVAPGEDIKDEFSPRAVALPEETWQDLLWRYGPYALVTLALLAASLWLLLRKRPREAPAAPRISPLEEARHALDALSREKPAALEFHEKLSLILRAYLEDGLGISAREATSSELIAHARRARVESLDLVTLEALLLENDLAKFAREKPPLPDLLRALGVVRDLVEASAKAPRQGKEVAS